MVRPSEGTEDNTSIDLTRNIPPFKLWIGWSYPQLLEEWESLMMRGSMLKPETHNTLFRLELKMLESQGVDVLYQDGEVHL